MNSSRSARLRWPFVGELALLVLLWLMLMQPVRTLAPSLDASWQMMLGYAYDHGLEYGRDVIPTMGPAGFLITASPSVNHLGLRFAWMLLGNGVLALIFWQLGRALGGWRRAIYFASMLLLFAPFAESMQGLAMLVLGLTLLRASSTSQRASICAGMIGVLALFKFTHLTLAVVLIAGATLHGFYRGGAGRALPILLGFGVGFAGGWGLLGQPLSAIPSFLRLSAEVSKGYVDGMSLYENGQLFWFGVSALLASGLYLWNYWRNEPDRPRASATALMLGTTWFLNWKHGFVRADGHTLTLFLACLFPVIAFPALTQEIATPCRQRRVALIAFLSLGGIWVGYAPALTQCVTTFKDRLVENVSLVAELRHPRELRETLRRDFSRFAQDHRLPRIAALVKSSSVDVLGTQQSIAMFENQNYTPRPVFQNYYAFTSRLAHLNEGFYASPRAPQFVIQKYETIDHRVPAMDDARVMTQVFRHYDLVAVENEWLLWEKREAPNPITLTAPEKSVVGFDREIPVPEVSEAALWVTIDVQPSLLGRLRSFFYKPPQLFLKVVDAKGASQSYRMIREMAADGFLLQPFFSTQADVVNYFTGHSTTAARSLTVTLPEVERAYFSPNINVAFFRLPALSHNAAPAPLAETRFRMFSLAPIRVESPHPAGPFILDGKEMFFIHAPGEMEFAPDVAVTHLSGWVGMSPGAYTGEGHTDGVEISIEHVSPAGHRTVLWHRVLDPLHDPADRALRSFSLALPGKGRILLKNSNGPKNDPSYDWTLWADLRFD